MGLTLVLVWFYSILPIIPPNWPPRALWANKPCFDLKRMCGPSTPRNFVPIQPEWAPKMCWFYTFIALYRLTNRRFVYLNDLSHSVFNKYILKFIFYCVLKMITTCVILSIQILFFYYTKTQSKYLTFREPEANFKVGTLHTLWTHKLNSKSA